QPCGTILKSVSLPDLSSSPSERRTRKGSDLDQSAHWLDVAEAFRQALIIRTGSLIQAYRVMDVSKTGEVDADSFKRGLRELGFVVRLLSCPH
ncbi:unnamed protein product, partial [Polarella glacialis]